LTAALRYIVLSSHSPKAMKTLDDFSAGPSGRAGAGASVLVVDDEAAVRRFAARVLEREGYGVLQASDGAEALDVVRAQAAPVGVVVSDIVMPRLNGVELMQALSVSHPRLPVILMSGYATAALSELGIAAPCSILTKPFLAERLLAEVQRCIHHRNGGSTAA
jgi:DNA-binding NtrC family response regulator